MFFNTYRRIAKSLEGSGLSKIPFIRRAHKRVIRTLAPEIVEIDGFKLKHLGQLDQENKLFLKMLRENIKEGNLVIDVGANIGYWTNYLARFVGESGRVYAFEPEPKNFEILKENRKLNDFKNVVIEQVQFQLKTILGFLS